MGVKVGEVFLSVTPETSAFASSLAAKLTPMLSGLGTKVPIGGDASGLEGVIGKSKKSLLALAGIAGVALGGKAIYDFLHGTVDAARAAEAAQRNVNVIFGQNAAAVTQWAQGAATAVGMSSGTAEAFAAKTANILEGFNLTTDFVGTHTTDTIKRMADVASKTGGDISGVQDALDSALAGRTRGLKQYGVVIDSTMIKAEAAKLGLTQITVDPDKVMKAQDALTSAQDNYNKTVAKAKDPRPLAEANNAVTLAYSRQQKALHDTGASSAAYMAATDSLMKAQDALTTVQGTQADSADALKLAQDRVTLAQSNLNDASAGTADALTPEATAMATLQLFMDKTTTSVGLFGQTNADQAQIASASWGDAKEAIGKALDPIITKLTIELGGWVRDHQGDIQNFAQMLATGLGYAADFVQLLLDHKDVILEVLAGFAVFHEIGSSGSLLNKLIGTGQNFLNFFRGGGLPSTATPAAQTVALAKTVAQMTVDVMTVNTMTGLGMGVAGAEGALATDGSLAADRALLTAPARTAAETQALVAAESAPIVATARGAAGTTMAVSMGAKIASMGMGAMIAVPFVTALFGIAADKGWLSSANPIDAFNSASAKLQGNMTGDYGGDTPGEQLRLFMLNRPDLNNMSQAVTSQKFSDLITQGGAAAPQELEQYALFAKDQASKTTGAEKEHWQKYADMFDGLNKLVAEGAVTTQGQLEQFLGYTGSLTQDIANFEGALHLSVYEANQSLVRNATSNATLTTRSTTGARGALLDSGAGGDVRSIYGVTRNAGGAYNPLPVLRVAGDAPGGEWTLRGDQMMQALVATAAQAGGGGDHIGQVNVYNPTSNVDPITAINRAMWHATYDERGFRPSGSGYRADQLVGGRR